MKRTPVFSWDEETGLASCFLYDHNNMYYGTAQCSPKDQDMKSEKVGCEIAYRRALIMALRAKRDELKTKEKALQEFYYTINTSKYFDAESYPIRRLMSHLEMLQDDLAAIKADLEAEQNSLSSYLKNKAAYWTKIRRNR